MSNAQLEVLATFRHEPHTVTHRESRSVLVLLRLGYLQPTEVTIGSCRYDGYAITDLGRLAYDNAMWGD